MASHNVARAVLPKTEAQRYQEADKIEKYRSSEDQLRQKVKQGSFDQSTFELTSKLLRFNPEYYTVWNVRRRCLICGLLSKPSAGSWRSTVLPSSSASDTPMPSSDALLLLSSNETQPVPDSPKAGTSGTIHDDGRKQEAESRPDEQQDDDTLRAELAFTVPLLMEFPKCYWIWNYRIWVLDQAVDRLSTSRCRSIWVAELDLVGKLLNKDRRNFHAWTYRRQIVITLESPALAGDSMVESEFAYTTKMIHSDLSNFSAWHNRSKLIPRLLNERGTDHVHRQELLNQELVLVQNCLNVGPEDQSLWYYHQFLISNIFERDASLAIAPDLSPTQRISYVQQEIEFIKDLLEDYERVDAIYEALIDHTMTLCEIRNQSPDEKDRTAIRIWLQKLKELDPQRTGRWRSLETRLRI